MTRLTYEETFPQRRSFAPHPLKISYYNGRFFHFFNSVKIKNASTNLSIDRLTGLAGGGLTLPRVGTAALKPVKDILLLYFSDIMSKGISHSDTPGMRC